MKELQTLVSEKSQVVTMWKWGTASTGHVKPLAYIALGKESGNGLRIPRIVIQGPQSCQASE
jgi:hypothetical protein